MSKRVCTLVLCAIVLTASVSCRRENGAKSARASSSPSSYPGATRVDVAQIEFDDGDTFLYRDEPIRVLGIDTPEVAEPDVGIFQDQPYGRAAADSTQALITRAGRVVHRRDGHRA